MMHTHDHRIAPTASLLLAALLVACGESDLPEYHEAVLACAELRAAGGNCDDGVIVEPATGAARPDDTDSDAAQGANADEDADADAEPDASDSDSAGSIGAGEQTPQGIDLAEYTLVFEDDFQGSELDYSKWKTALEWGPDLVVNGEQQYYIDTENRPGFGHDAHLLDGETLQIVARRTPEQLSEAANDQPWLSGVISTADDFTFQYGYVEARIDAPAGIGLTPSVWMLGSEYAAGALNPRVFLATLDGAATDRLVHDYQFEDADGNTMSPGQFEVEDEALEDGFHTVGLSWTPDELVYYVDGIARYRVVGDQLPAQPMYLILNLAIGGVSVDAPEASTPDGSALAIDWVRVWQLL